MLRYYSPDEATLEDNISNGDAEGRRGLVLDQFIVRCPWAIKRKDQRTGWIHKSGAQSVGFSWRHILELLIYKRWQFELWEKFSKEIYSIMKSIYNGWIKKGEPVKENGWGGWWVASRKQKKNQVTKVKRSNCSKKEGMTTTFNTFERYRMMKTWKHSLCLTTGW